MKKIIVFGASGGTGIEVVKLSLAADHEVTAVVRKPDAFTLRHPKLTFIKGDVMDPPSFGITAGALDTNPAMGFFIRTLTKVVLQKILKEPYADMRLMESELFQSGIDYMIIRPAMLKDKPQTGSYRTAINGHIEVPFSIARADVAHYITTHLEDPQTFRSIVEIAY